jgi:hypothetical protein
MSPQADPDLAYGRSGSLRPPSIDRGSSEGAIMTSTSRAYIRLLVGALAAAGLMAGIAIPVLADAPVSLTSTDYSHGTAQATMAKTLTGKARIIDGRHSL